MALFKIDTVKFLNLPVLPIPDSQFILGLVKANNVQVSVTYDPKIGSWVVECDNKPRDSVLFGISWIRIDD